MIKTCGRILQDLYHTTLEELPSRAYTCSDGQVTISSFSPSYLAHVPQQANSNSSQVSPGSNGDSPRSSHCESQRHMSPPLARFDVPFVAESGRRACLVVNESWLIGPPAAHCYAAQAFMIHRQLVGYATKTLMLLVPPQLLPRPCQYDLDAGLEWYCVKIGRRSILIQSDCPTSPLKSYHSSPCVGRLGIGLSHQCNEFALDVNSTEALTSTWFTPVSNVMSPRNEVRLENCSLRPSGCRQCSG